MGSSGKGIADALNPVKSWDQTLQMVFDPGGTLVQAVQKNTPLKNVAFLEGLTNAFQQPVDNISNVLKGKETFGQHTNWAGEGWVGNNLNWIAGGLNDRDRKAYEANQKAWRDYYTQLDTKQKSSLTDLSQEDNMSLLR